MKALILIGLLIWALFALDSAENDCLRAGGRWSQTMVALSDGTPTQCIPLGATVKP